MALPTENRFDFYDCYRALLLIQEAPGLTPDPRDQEIKHFYSTLFRSNGWLDEFGGVTWNAHIALDRMEEFHQAFGPLYAKVDHHLFTKTALKVLNLRADMSLLRSMQMICTVMPALQAMSEAGEMELTPQAVSATLSIKDLLRLYENHAIPVPVRSRIADYMRSLPGATDWKPGDGLAPSAEDMHNQVASQVAQILLMMA